MFGLFEKGGLAKSYDAQEKLDEKKSDLENDIRKADEAIDEAHLEHRIGSGIHLEAKRARSDAIASLQQTGLQQDRLDYYNEVKDEVGGDDEAVLGKMQEDAHTMNKERDEKAI